MVEQATDKQGVGSIWNKGNWHWEERNYNEFAKQWLSENLTTIMTPEAPDSIIEVYEVKSIKAEASVAIRKGKQIFMYEFETTLYFKAASVEDDRTNMMGQITIHEMNQEDDEVSMEYVCEKPGRWADGVRTYLRKDMPQVLYEVIQGLVPAMKERDTDDQKLAAAKKAEKDAEAEYKQVHEDTNEEKMAIAEANLKKEEEMKKEEKKKEALKKLEDTTPEVSKKVEVAGEGSVWNQNGFQWEEKTVNKWADETMRKILSNFVYRWQDEELNDIKIKVQEIKRCQGEASLSIRKGKKIISYDYDIMVLWRCAVVMVEMKDMEIGFISGFFEFPEICADEEMADWQCKSGIFEDKNKFQDRLYPIIKKDAMNALKNEIQEKFIDELAKK